jgi:tetrahydromethanopterin S-methyltransferase subunit G
MSDDRNSEVLDFPREQFARVHAKLDLIGNDVSNLKGRVSGLEADAGHTRVALAELNARVDRVDMRLERIERRLDLVDHAAL